MAAKGQKCATSKFDPEFSFLPADEGMERWRTWAAQYWSTFYNGKAARNPQTAVSQFLVNYVHGLGLHNLQPPEFFAKARALPPIDDALCLEDITGESNRLVKLDNVSDFLDWILREQLSEEIQHDGQSLRLVPGHLHNPFPRRRPKKHGKITDLDFKYLLLLDSRWEDWRALAAQWVKEQTVSVAPCRVAIDKFLAYLHDQGQEFNWGRWLLRDTLKPSFRDYVLATKSKGSSGLSRGDVKILNSTSSFIDWVLKTQLGDEHGVWDNTRFHNPIDRLTNTGLTTPNETNKAALSIRHIEQLRKMLAQGRTFRDWTWAQEAMEGGSRGGDWFKVDESLVDRADPDCVWRERQPTPYEKEVKGYPARVFELWSPIRAVVLYIKLELPLRTFQVRMLDSGEADTWRYEHGDGLGTSCFVRNHGHLATGDDKRPHQRGVFHRTQGENEAGIYINTNKTSDIDKAENEKGYVIPWAHPEVLYWLTKLRNWQQRYNPIAAPTPWTELGGKHFGRTPPHPAVLAQRGRACFLMRDPTDEEKDKPLASTATDALWRKLMERLEQHCADERETLPDGSPLKFVVSESNHATYFPLHALRVSLITFMVLDQNLPIAVVSKLIAGHSRIVMTLYYTKFGKAQMREVLEEAERNDLEAKEKNYRRIMNEASYEQFGQHFATLSEDAVRAALAQKTAAGFTWDERGICPNNATMCDVGGEKVTDRKLDDFYAPVPGFPTERNCVLCRFFISTPAHLPALIALFNAYSLKSHTHSRKSARLRTELDELQAERAWSASQGLPFANFKRLEAASKRVESAEVVLQQYVNALIATNAFIRKCLDIEHADGGKEGIKLVASGSMTDLAVGFQEANSEIHQLEVVCQNAVVYPDLREEAPILRRGQILDAMLEYNDLKPIFMKLDEDTQLIAGNALMNLIKTRAGSIKDALPFVEAQRLLSELGISSDDVSSKLDCIPAKHLLASWQGPNLRLVHSKED